MRNFTIRLTAPVGRLAARNPPPGGRRIVPRDPRGHQMKHGMAIGLAATLLLSGTAQASGINGINGGMPNRISMNVTVPKQTQGATFGEKVNAGLHAAGSAVAQGAALSLAIECGQAACVVTLPDGGGFRADLQRRRVEVLKSNKRGDPDTSAARPSGQGASLVGGALPGGSIISATVSSVGALAGHGGGAAAASYAASGRVAGTSPLASRVEGATVDVLDPLVDGDYTLTLVVDNITSGMDTLATQKPTVAPRVQITLGFSVEAGVLKTRHDTAKNTIGNIR